MIISSYIFNIFYSLVFSFRLCFWFCPMLLPCSINLFHSMLPSWSSFATMCSFSLKWFYSSLITRVRSLWLIHNLSMPQKKSEIRFCACPNSARGVSEICNGENFWQWSRLEIRHKRLSSLNHYAKTIHHLYQFMPFSLLLAIKSFFYVYFLPNHYFQEHFDDSITDKKIL